ncbi:MAG: SDR family oxidoreductase [Myxococcales bacterium]|nr:SDR family oxidoreductase [Myxococcales bacterium]
MDVRGKVVVVTGASRGLGRAVAERWAAEGARVALVARGEEVVEVASALRERGLDAAAFRADVGDVEQVDRLVAQVHERLGPVEVLVHAAGTLGPVPMPMLLDAEPGDLREALATNVVGPFHLVRRLAGPMVLRGRGLVVCVSSDAAVERYPRWGVYAAGKAAMDLLVGTFAAELEGTGVRFVSVDPGEMDTVMHAMAVPDADPASLRRPDDVAAALIAGLGRELPSRLVVEV